MDGNQLNAILNKLVEEKLLCIGNFISRPKAKSTFSYMKNAIPNDPIERETFEQHLQQYKINVNEYKFLLARSAVPNRCILLPEAIELLTSSPQDIDDCAKYGLKSKSMRSYIVLFMRIRVSN